VSDVNRRDALKILGATASAATATGCSPTTKHQKGVAMKSEDDVTLGANAILATVPLGFPWKTPDPFLFCVHHDDKYPAGNEHMGPAAALDGRNLGQDFEGKDGWRMYHGELVPGFPQHPHRGFETVTVVRKGLLDHSDSLGAGARYGGGDVQWLTAGKGILHSEMFPLLNRGAPNPLELFQIWLNLPAADKMVDPYFSMLWSHTIPKHTARDGAGRATELTVVAGRYQDLKVSPPPPNSWASRPNSDVAIWTLKLAPGARFTVPAASAGVNRTLYFFRGNGLRAGGHVVPASHGLELRGDSALSLVAGEDEAELLLLQGRPIGEPVAQYGPFVMNTEDEIRQAFADYQRTRFGGWPWKSDEPVHPRDQSRFARHIDGRFEQPG
jgi:redox-sensitive bicupin YhaK (pirin superfamily)